MWKAFWTAFLNRKIESKTGLIPISNRRPNDIYIIGFPRSGHTWMQNIMANLLYDVNPAAVPDSIIQDIIPDIHHRGYYRRLGDEMVFKSHELPEPVYQRVIYLIRDGRDVAVSFYHFTKARNPDQKDFLVPLSSRLRREPVPWQEHVEAWLSNPCRAQIHIVRYEQLLNQTLSELQRLCLWLKLERSDEQLSEVAAHCAFEKLQAKEKREGREKWPRDKPFIRRGVIGSHKDEFPAEQLQQFERAAGPLLRRLGYKS